MLPNDDFLVFCCSDPEELKRAQEEMGGQGGVPSLANFLAGAQPQRTN